jgi:hypothetical protein
MIIQRHEIDLTGERPETVVAVLDEVVSTGETVLHGSLGNFLYLASPVPARDIYRKSGCQRAIYSTSVVGMALRAAMLNKPLLSAVSTFGRAEGLPALGVTSMKSSDGWSTEYGFMPTIHDILETSLREGGSTDLLKDGYVYEVPVELAEESPDALYEWFSIDPMAVRRVYHVGASVSRLLFGDISERFVTRPFDVEEINRIMGALALTPSVH